MATDPTKHETQRRTRDPRWLPWPLIAALAAALALANPSLPASPFASVASAQTPTPAPVVPDQPFVVKLSAPADGTGGFAVVVTKPSSGIARWKNSLPAGAMALDLTDNSGRPVMVFLNPKPGRYEFNLSVQLPVGITKENTNGLDPFAEDALVVVVRDPNPVVVTPKPQPTTPDTPTTPDVPPVVDPSTKPTAAYYIFEKDNGAVPPAVQTALDKLVREKKIDARPIEQDVTDGTDRTPEAFKAPIAAAKQAGLPSLVVMAGTEIVSVVLNPTTEAAILKEVP